MVGSEALKLFFIAQEDCSRNRRVKLASELKEPIKPPVKEN